MNKLIFMTFFLSVVSSALSVFLLIRIETGVGVTDTSARPDSATAVGMPFEGDRALPAARAGSNWGIGGNQVTPQVLYTSNAPSGPDQIDGSGLDLVGVSGIVPDASGVNIGVQGQVASNATGAGGVLAQSTSASGQTFGLIATAQSPSGAAAFLGSINNADLINSTNNAFNVDGAGNVDANSFSGDGSALTGITVGDGAITNEKLAQDAVTSSKILNGSIRDVDLVDEAVTNAKLAQNAVTSSRILDSSVRSQDIANGTIEIEDMGFAAYRAKQDIYINAGTADAIPGLTVFPRASCNDTNDLAIAGTCPSSGGTIFAGVDLLYFGQFAWDLSEDPAEFVCGYKNESFPQTVMVEARIICLDIP